MTVTQRMRAMCLPECVGSPSPIWTLQRGQRWVNFLKPGRQPTNKEANQDPKRQQVIAKHQPDEVISLSTSVTIYKTEGIF